jgi:hypothetical protein
MTPVHTGTRPRSAWVLFALLVVQAASGIGGGAALVAGPRGEVTGLRLSDLEGSPFDSFLIPGVVLLLVLGVLPLVAAVGLLQRRPWAWWLAGVVGCGLAIWIAVQMTVIDFSWLQVAYAGMAAAIVLACLQPSLRRHVGVAGPQDGTPGGPRSPSREEG